LPTNRHIISVDGALAGLRVLDLGGTIATGYCAKLFADHGAEVINVEPPGGFATRRMAPLFADAPPNESSALHAWLAANKSSVVLDVEKDSARLSALLASADVAIEGSEDGSIDTGTLGEMLGEGLLMSITWFGANGPRAGWRCSDTVTHAMIGMLHGIGTREGPPIAPNGPQAQVVGGLTAYIGAMGAVVARELGNAQARVHMETSIVEANACFTEFATYGAFNGAPSIPRLGINRFVPTYPLGAFPCRDGWIGLVVLTPAQWHSFCALIGLDELTHDEQYQTTMGRLQDADFLESVFRPKLLEWSAEDLFVRAQELRVPLALVPTMEELFLLEQYRGRGAFGEFCHPDLRSFEAPITPFRLLRTPPRPGGDVSRLGADQEILEV